jgi:hypothetical protein
MNKLEKKLPPVCEVSVPNSNKKFRECSKCRGCLERIGNFFKRLVGIKIEPSRVKTESSVIESSRVKTESSVIESSRVKTESSVEDYKKNYQEIQNQAENILLKALRECGPQGSFVGMRCRNNVTAWGDPSTMRLYAQLYAQLEKEGSGNVGSNSDSDLDQELDLY